jgi:hypothetical protein
VQPRNSHRAHAPRRGAPGSALTAHQNSGGATYFRCGGCGTAAVFAQQERRYGRLVRDFFDRHERCGNAVEISAADATAAREHSERVPAGI